MQAPPFSQMVPTRLPPVFPFYGSNWRAAPRYGIPRYETIIEPFAGSATYSLNFPDRQVVLVEKDPRIVGVLGFIIAASPAEIQALPDLLPGESVDDLRVCPEARDLIGFCISRASAMPKKTRGRTKYAEARGDTTRWNCYWGPKLRRRLAATVPHIKHWRVIGGDYSIARNRDATWFIDPPYLGAGPISESAGRHYRHGSGAIDYDDLGQWCRSRRGQVIVCEQEGATWLPFRPFRAVKTNEGRNGRNGQERRGKSIEVVWKNDWNC